MPLVLGGSAVAAAAYSIDNSCRFNGGDSARLTSDFVGTGSSSAAIATYSMWVKLALEDNRATVISGMDDESNYLKVRFADDGAGWYFAIYGGSPACDLRSNAVFRDPSAWYNVVMAFDTAQATDTNRIKVWINGTQITWSTATFLAQDSELFLTKSDDLEIGSHNNTEFFDGYMAELVCIDGTALDETSFGEFDSDSPTIWKPKDVSGLTFGTKGYWLDFGDSAALGDDVSGNNNDFTEVNIVAADKSQDSPTNNFSTMNPLNTSSYMALSNGNNTCTGSSASDKGSTASTISPNAGKWYAECKYTNVAHTNYPRAGMFQIDSVYFGRLLNGDTGMAGYSPSSFSYFANRILLINNSETADWGSAVSSGDITAIAIDCDNGAAYFAIENTWQDSGDPTSGASKTGAAVTWTPASFSGIAFSDSEYNGSYTEWNFGNGCFGDTVVTSAEADGNGYGLFEYAPPSGYLALCTKNLGSDGG